MKKSELGLTMEDWERIGNEPPAEEPSSTTEATVNWLNASFSTNQAKADVRAIDQQPAFTGAQILA